MVSRYPSCKSKEQISSTNFNSYNDYDQDAGGAEPNISKFGFSLSRLALFWMSAEAEKAGLRFDETLKRIWQAGIPYKNLCMRENDEGNFYSDNRHGSEPYLSDLLYASETLPMHQETSFGNGWYAVHVLKQRIKNMLQARTFSQSTALRRGQREIPEYAHIHSSVIRRMKADCSYRPSNLPIESDLDSLKILNEGDQISECFVWNPTTLHSTSCS